MEVIQLLFAPELINATLRIMTPLLLAALGGLIIEKSGILSIGLEGLMLGGAFAGFLGAYLTQSLGGGLLCACLSGALMGFLLAFFYITLAADQVVVALVFNTFILGLTSFLDRLTFGVGGKIPKVPELGIIRLPFLSKIPCVGEILFVNQSIVFVALLFVPLAGIFLYHTTWGLTVRYVGENPRGADALGTRVFLTRYLCVIASGVLAALGGSILTLGQTHLFQQNLTAGRGYVALAAVIFGRWNPYGILLAVLLFGFADALQLRIQGLGLPIPYEIPVMFPYILTIVALIVLRGKASGPASLGNAYLPES
jgi:ABC-type uncharacterized transport system permease subunit